MTLYIQSEGSEDKPALVLMHFLGGSGREWDEVVSLLGGEYRTVRIDLPGFGESADVPGYTVAEMADTVHAAISAARLKRYVLVGHSMSGKVAMVLARRAADVSDTHLAGLLLVAPSPPGPEPIPDEKRSMMLDLLGEAHDDDRARARSYITKNELRDIPPEVEERASNEVLRMNRMAWVAWLQHGSKEDWAERVGKLELPVMVIAGEKDLSLGPNQQQELTMPHLLRGELRTVPNCSHLIPMECAPMMTQLIREFMNSLSHVPAPYLNFIAGERLSEPTRKVIESRLNPPAIPAGVLTGEQIKTLRAMLTRILPQETVDVTPYVLERLAKNKGDGWRYAVLPVDLEAYREGLDRLAEKGFAEMEAAAQDAALTELASKKGSPDARWFEEVRGDATTAYVSHPATMARLGYSGIGVGGAETKYQGFVTIGLNEREEWEPVAEVVA